MAFRVNESIDDLQKQQAFQMEKVAPRVVETIIRKKDETINFFIVWTAVSLYYFFSGLTMLIRGRLPRGWTHFEKKKLISLISNIGELTQLRKEIKKYGKVVDLDKPSSKSPLI